MTKRFLNLGCGRAVFPTTPDNPFTKHLLYALEAGCPAALDPEANWTNADRHPGEGIQETFDVFAYPFVRGSNGSPYNDDTFDEIWLSHLAEHIPHDPRWTFYADKYPELKRAGEEDGFYVFFTELWRIAKPDGIIHVVSPTANHYSAFGDPQHRRYLVPQVFSYFKPNPDAPFDYHIPARFEAVGEPEVKIVGDEAIAYHQAHQAAVAVLRQAQEEGASGPMLELAETNVKKTHELFNNFVASHWNTVSEFFVSLRVIKE